MFKHVRIIVWSAFIFWMIFFVFSLSHAQADTDSQVFSTTKKFKNYGDYLCRQFSDMGHCQEAAYKIIGDEIKTTGDIPTNSQSRVAKSLELAIEICNFESKNQNTSFRERSHCFRVADKGLSGENLGNHPECHVLEAKWLWKFTDRDFQKEANCYQKAFEVDKRFALAQAKWPVDPDVLNFKARGAILCHGIKNIKDDANITNFPQDFRGLLVMSRNSCQQREDEWADTALKTADGKIPVRSENQKRLLLYQFIEAMCLDKSHVNDAKYVPKCLYSAGLTSTGYRETANYRPCISVDLVESDATGDNDKEANLTIAKNYEFSNRTYDLNNYLNCYKEQFSLDYARVKADVVNESKESKQAGPETDLLHTFDQFEATK